MQTAEDTAHIFKTQKPQRLYFWSTFSNGFWMFEATIKHFTAQGMPQVKCHC